MRELRDDAGRAPEQRRARASLRPTRVVGPLLLVVLVQVLAVVAGLALGLSVVPVALIALGIGVAAPFLAPRTTASLVAGAGIRLAQPYTPGEHVRLYVPSLRSVEDAEVVRVGPANTTLMTSSGLVLVPNSQMLRGSSHHPPT